VEALRVLEENGPVGKDHGNGCARDGVALLAADGARPGMAEHVVQFYEDDGRLVDAAAHFVGNGLQFGGGGVLIATEDHRERTVDRLGQRGIDVRALRQEGRLVTLDAHETLDRILVGHMPDPARFAEVVGDVLTRATSGAEPPHAWAFGEMVAILWDEGKREAAVRLERLWNDLARRHSLSLLCAYPMSAFGGDPDTKSFHDMCCEHSRVVPSEAYGTLAGAERDLFVAQLQQKALTLDHEVARRRFLEDTLRRREKELTEILENMTDAVVDVDPDGRIRWGNRAFLDLLGYEGRECGGLLVAEVLGRPECFPDLLGSLLRGQSLAPLALDLRTKGGDTVEAFLQAASLRTEGKSLHVRWILRRIPTR
jgi:PAS domain S-box-containing protein